MPKATASKVKTATPKAKTKTKTNPEAAAQDGVAWSKRHRARLFGSLRPLPMDPVAPGPDAAWSALRDLYGEPKLYALPRDASRDAEPTLDELRRELRSPTPPTTTTPERELLRFALVQSEGTPTTHWDKRNDAHAEAFVALWAGLWGVAFASRVVWMKYRSLSSITSGDARRAYVSKGKPETQMLADSEIWWLNLRRLILAAPPAEYDEVEQIWRDAGASTFEIAATFCRSNDRANALIAKELTRPQVTYGSIVLLSAVTDPELALQFARAQPLNYAHGAGRYAFHLVDNLGTQAAPVLIALLERVTSGAEARRALSSAAALADPDACRTALKKLKGPAATTLAAALK